VPDLHESSWRRSGRRDSDHYSRSFSGHCPARFAPDCGVSNVRLSIVNASNEATLRTVLASVANKMLADFNASSVAKHSGSKGTVREAQLLSNYLRKYLPRNVIAEHSGEVVAANGAVSGQCDIVIVDPSTPPFWDDEDYRIVPAECVYGVIEVKSSLDASELRKAWKQIARVKALPKTALPSRPTTTDTENVRTRLAIRPHRGNRVRVRRRWPRHLV
jgi:hypothetical protein